MCDPTSHITETRSLYQLEIPTCGCSIGKQSLLLCRWGQWRSQKFCSGVGWGSTNSVEDRGQRKRGSGGGSPLVRGSGGSCNLVQEISFHIVKFS